VTVDREPNLAALLLEHPFADDAGLLHTVDRTVTAGAARQAARRLTSELEELGAAAGQAVAVRLPNGPDVVTAMAGIWSLGAVFVPVNSRLPDRELHGVLGPSAPAALVDVGGIRRLSGARDYQHSTAFVLWTSGTTGRLEPILHTHQGYTELLDRVLGSLRQERAGAGRGGSGDRDRDRGGRPVSCRAPSPNLIPVSLALNAGIYNALFGLRAGAAPVIVDRFSTGELAQLVRRFEIRSTVLPPAAITMCNRDPDLASLSPLRYVRSITAPLSVQAARQFTERFGVFVLNSYGQAEIGEVVGWTAADARAHPEKIGAAGRALPGVSVKVVGDDGIPMAPDEVGRLLVRPPSMASGYVTGSELADRLDAAGYLDTGDHARVDADGFIWIQGRSSDLINRGGSKVFPDEVEEVLRLDPSVSDVAVAGVPDDRLGQVPVAFVVTSGEIDAAALHARCRDHLTPYKVPVEYVRVDALPRNAVGKILRRQLVADYQRTTEEATS